ncbi:hypothetical protein NDU88_007190 [Pleurodeles waltl]|uniref:Uncharacterized protein n=1 Tax=Pleurodeles waltl TaxID=8319 RepID=A0AAV7VNZ9_PLEWA|nr:hypothetical protein NDU88_007190 [Pleurodeles waltl]
MYRPAILGVSFLRPLEPLALVSGGGMGLRWQDWLEDFEDFMKGSQVTDLVQQIIALCNLIGEEVGQIIKELPKDIIISRGPRASQEKDESMGEFILQLKRLAQYCVFDTFTTEDTLRLRIIEVFQSESLRICLSKKRYSFDEIEEMTRVNDKAEEHVKKMEAGKIEKREEAFKLKNRQNKRQSPERRRIPKPQNIPDK